MELDGQIKKKERKKKSLSIIAEATLVRDANETGAQF